MYDTKCFSKEQRAARFGTFLPFKSRGLVGDEEPTPSIDLLVLYKKFGRGVATESDVTGGQVTAP